MTMMTRKQLLAHTNTPRAVVVTIYNSLPAEHCRLQTMTGGQELERPVARSDLLSFMSLPIPLKKPIWAVRGVEVHSGLDFPFVVSCKFSQQTPLAICYSELVPLLLFSKHTIPVSGLFFRYLLTTNTERFSFVSPRLDLLTGRKQFIVFQNRFGAFSLFALFLYLVDDAG